MHQVLDTLVPKKRKSFRHTWPSQHRTQSLRQLLPTQTNHFLLAKIHTLVARKASRVVHKLVLECYTI